MRHFLYFGTVSFFVIVVNLGELPLWGIAPFYCVTVSGFTAPVEQGLFIERILYWNGPETEHASEIVQPPC